MAILKELRIPHMGSVENAKLVAWRVPEGSAFHEGEILYDVETDKTVTEVQAQSSGILARRLAEEGAELKVGDLIAFTADAGTSTDEISRAMVTPKATLSAPTHGALDDVRSEATTRPQQQGADTPRISPRARRLAKERGIDLATLTGDRAAGRVSGEDVMRAAAAPALLQSSSESATLSIPGYERVPVDVVVNSTRRRAIARRLAESVRAAPQLTADMQVDLSALISARAELNSRLRKEGRAHISVLSYVARATANLLLEHRDLNAAFRDSHTLRWKVVNLGIAVDTPEGLVVPVIRDAAAKSLEDINSAIASLAEQARLGTLRQEDLEGGTFTISNPGAIGPVLRAEAILNPPQVALLGLPGIQYAPVAIELEDYRVEVRPILRPSLTFDHRALDGGQVIRFLSALKRMLENPKGT